MGFHGSGKASRASRELATDHGDERLNWKKKIHHFSWLLLILHGNFATGVTEPKFPIQKHIPFLASEKWDLGVGLWPRGGGKKGDIWQPSRGDRRSFQASILLKQQASFISPFCICDQGSDVRKCWSALVHLGVGKICEFEYFQEWPILRQFWDERVGASRRTSSLQFEPIFLIPGLQPRCSRNWTKLGGLCTLMIRVRMFGPCWSALNVESCANLSRNFHEWPILREFWGERVRRTSLQLETVFLILGFQPRCLRIWTKLGGLCQNFSVGARVGLL